MAGKKQVQPWSLDSREIYEIRDAGIRSHRGAVARRSRADRGSVGPGLVRLGHHPTGIEVSEEIPRGRYTRDELRQLQDRVAVRLLAGLERKVAKALHIPGRSN